MHSASAVADIRHILAAACQCYIIQRHAGIMHIQQAGTVLVALQTGQPNIGQSQRQSVRHRNHTGQVANITILRKRDIMAIAVDGQRRQTAVT